MIDGASSYGERMDITTVSSNYQVVIPRRIREQFGLSPGQQLQVIALPGRIELVPSLLHRGFHGWATGRSVS
jgi:AbrB family looped-hinge helix DNA binding protein